MEKNLILIGGPHGCGKTSLYEAIKTRKQYFPFLNADMIAVASEGLQGVHAEIEAGKILLRQLDEKISNNQSVAVETTMSGKLWISRIKRARQSGYKIISLFVTLDNIETSISRIKKRQSLGGHFIPEATVRRRWHRCHLNFWKCYRQLSDTWFVFDNTQSGSVVVAQKTATGEIIYQPKIIKRIEDYARQ